jgi:predicted transcriptional regulator
MSTHDDTIERLRRDVAAQRGRFDELSSSCGMSKSWISKFAAGRFDPRWSTIQRVRAAVDAMAEEHAA